MKKTLSFVAIVAGLGVSIYFVGSWLMNSGSASESETTLSDEVNYLCRETGQIIRGPRDPGLEGMIVEGQGAGDCQTLVQALYCPQCKSWYPYPPPEALERMPMGPRCPTHRTGLLEEIPEPADGEEVAR